MSRIYPINLEGQLMTAWRIYREHCLNARWDSARLSMSRIDAILDEMGSGGTRKAPEKPLAPRWGRGAGVGGSQSSEGSQS